MFVLSYWSSFVNITVINSQLQSSYETLSKNHSKLQDEVKKLKDEIQGEKRLKTERNCNVS